ncbi:MAG: hypothetical protein IKP88_18675 [Lachnospiraceae bacterium]|nr:hypothetical protein [Lachnospiraceae bacterium]
MKSMILSRVDVSGFHTLYLVAENKEYYLFRQAYRRGVADYYRKGVTVDAAINYSKAKYDNSVIHTMSKLLSHIRYVEKESGIVVLDRTRKMKNFRKRYL